jgi:hypothetical protein
MRLATRCLTAFFLVSGLSTAAALGGIIYVNAAAAGANDGTSWANAYTSLQTALGTAGSGDDIWVVAGTYRPTSGPDRTISFALKNGVGVYGGFDGTESQRSQRDPSANVTILSGDLGTPGSATDNSFHVVTADGTVTSTGVLDGFTVTAGQANGDPLSFQDRGAGMWDNGGSPTLSRVTFSGNVASAEGGGLRVTSGAPILLNCLFQGNSVGFGGKGGGIYAGGGSSVTAQGCVFRSNSIASSSTGGGGLESGGAVLTLINCVVAQNDPNGLQVSSVDGNLIDNCTFTANHGYGAAFTVSNGNTLSNDVFWGDLVPEIFLSSASVSATYSDIQGGGFAGAGNIDFNPLFIAPPADLRPGAGSPAVDSGNNSAVPGGVITDIAGLPRFFDDPDVPDTGAGLTPPYVDMGAYERIPITVSDPASEAVCSGSSAVFAVTAAGQAPLSYGWRKNGSPLSDGGAISGSTTDTLTIDPTVPGDTGSYDVVVTDGFGQSITSTAATLTVNARPTAAASGSATICAGDATPLTGSGGTGCSWSPATGLSDASSCTPSASPASTTIYTLTVVAANGCSSTNNPTVTVTVNPVPTLPVITAPLSVPVGASGASASVANHPGATWNWTLSGGVITAGQTTRQIVFDAGSPGTTMVCTVVESNGGCSSPMASKRIQVDFLDMPPSNTFHDFVNTVARNGVTAGCGGGNYCGTAPVTRAQMAVFLLKAKHGSAFVPPSCAGIFDDVACPGGFAVDWIEELFNEGITGGCGGTSYCPSNAVRRDQMAVFLLKASQGSSYAPPAATGAVFADVPANAFAADWIEDLYARNITSGCMTNPLRYCPSNTNNRQQMAVFLTKTFGLQ